MRLFFPKILAIGLLGIGCVSVAYSQQAAPVNVMPAPTQKATISPTMTVVTPAGVSELAPVRTEITPQAPGAPVETKPSLPLPAAVETNTVPAAGTAQPAPPSAPQASSWSQTSEVHTSAWDKASALAKPAPDLWSKQPANSRIWDSTIPVNSTGATTQWK
jgi:hypothetical protein